MSSAAKKITVPAQQPAGDTAVKTRYLDALHLVERLHRRLLDVIKDEFERRGRDDVNSVQALLLYNIGDKELTASELRSRGYYLGSNVSYNVKKLVEAGYLHHARSRVDRRAVRISLTEKGKILSLSFYRDEAAVEAWRNISEHRRGQAKGRADIFDDYRIRVVGVIQP